MFSHISCMLTAVVVIASLTGPALGDTTIKSFYGHYEGTGILASEGSAADDMLPRDLDVEIGPDGKGFFVKWTTVIRDRLGDKPRRNTAQISFVPGSHPGMYLEKTAQEQVKDGRLSWAGIIRDSLVVNVLSVLKDGRYELHSYNRKLIGDGMFLQFTALRDGLPVRKVSASLTRVKP